MSQCLTRRTRNVRAARTTASSPRVSRNPCLTTRPYLHPLRPSTTISTTTMTLTMTNHRLTHQRVLLRQPLVIKRTAGERRGRRRRRRSQTTRATSPRPYLVSRSAWRSRTTGTSTSAPCRRIPPICGGRVRVAMKIIRSDFFLSRICK